MKRKTNKFMKSFTPDSYRATRFATKNFTRKYILEKFYLLDGATIGGHTRHIINFRNFAKSYYSSKIEL